MIDQVEKAWPWPRSEAEDDVESRDERWLAESLSVSRRTVQAWRQRGAGPPYLRLPSGAVRYRVRDVALWLSDHTVYP